MSRYRGQKDAAGISLFPFLAVLICTMGALIVLLVVIARQVRLQVARAQQEVTTNAEDQQQLWDRLQAQIDTLAGERERRRQQLQDARQELGRLEAESRALEDRLLELEAASDGLNAGQSRDENQLAVARAELERLERRIAQLTTQLDDARRRSQQQQTSYAIVPYQGPNQTHRRPLYIECRADSIVLQPEGIELTEDDFNGTLSPASPLAASLRAAAEYLRRGQHTDHGEMGEPYPLLLVRPDGINAYYAARTALRAAGSDFGYELVDADWQLDFQSPDAELALVEARAVDEARKRQQSLARVEALHARRQMRGTFRVSPGGGGLVPVGPGSQGSGSAYNGGGDPGGSSFGGDRPRSAGDRYAGSVANSQGAGEVGDPDRSGSSRYAGIGQAESAPGSVSGSRVGSDGQHTGNSAYPTLDELTAGGAAGNNLPGRGTAGQTGDPLAGGPEGLASRPTGESIANPGTGGAAAGGMRGGSQSMAGQASSSASPAAGGSGGSPENRHLPGMPWQSQAGQSAGEQSAAQPAIPPQQVYNPNQQPGSAGASGDGQCECLAERRGENWALPDSSRGSFPVTRPIRIEVRPDRVTVWPEVAGIGRPKVISLGQRTADYVDELVSAVWQRIDSWGIAGRGLYWRPILHVDAMPGAGGRMQDLQTLMAESGIAIRDRAAPLQAQQSERYER